MSHVKVKMHQILFPASVCSFVRVKLHLRLKTHGVENRRRFSTPKTGAGFRPRVSSLSLRNGRTDGRRTDGQYVDVTRALCINVKSYTMLQRSLHNVRSCYTVYTLMKHVRPVFENTFTFFFRF